MQRVHQLGGLGELFEPIVRNLALDRFMNVFVQRYHVADVLLQNVFCVSHVFSPFVVASLPTSVAQIMSLECTVDAHITMNVVDRSKKGATPQERTNDER